MKINKALHVTILNKNKLLYDTKNLVYRTSATSGTRSNQS